MIKKITDFIIENAMLTANDTVVCGLSGGADSVCLLLTMLELNISVEALHINHCLRGSESDRDEQFCRELCARLGVPFTAISCDVNAYSHENGLSTEEAAREMRYAEFAKHSQGKKLATAHNASDNLETALLNLARGTALKGIAGIPPVRGNIIRPLLVCTRAEIEQYLNERGQSWVTDSTNLSDSYTRNKIRHGIIPLLEEINPSAVQTSVRSLSALRAEDEFIEQQVEAALEKCRSGNVLRELREYSEVIRRRCIARLLSDNSLPYSFKRLQEADGILKSGGKLNISGDSYLISDDCKIELSVIPHKKQELVKKPLQIGENSIFEGKALMCELIECDDLTKIESVHKNLTFYMLDYDKIVGRAIVRSRIFGDRITLKGRSFASSVKKLINENIPAAQRAALHFIEDEEGTIFAEGMGIAQRVAPDASTKRILRVHVVSTK